MQISVIGAGTMGHGIAQASSMAGHEVTLRDIDESVLDEALAKIEENLNGAINHGKINKKTKQATINRTETTTSLERAVSDADLIIEAVPEDVELKQKIFQDIETEVGPDTIIATNTSSLSVTEIASVLDHPGRALGMHFFNPVHIMDLVEVVVGERTDQATVEFTTEFVTGIDKTSVEIKDRPGFATSRLGVALGVEAARMVEEGVAAPRDIDTAMQLGYNHPVGPLELTDMVGLDVRLDVLEYLQQELGERFRPPQLLKQKVRAGKLGQKTGEGFYIWENDEIVGVSDN